MRLPIGETVIAIGLLALATVMFAQTMAAPISPRPSAGVTRRPVLSRFPRTGAGDSGTGRASPHRLGSRAALKHLRIFRLELDTRGVVNPGASVERAGFIGDTRYVCKLKIHAECIP